VFWRPEGGACEAGRGNRAGVVVAGPGSSLTIPGIIVSEIVRALATTNKVTRIEVDVAADFMAGLHRAPSLAAANGAYENSDIERHRAPNNARLRLQAFRDWITPETGTVIAYAWPGLDNSWIKQFLQVAKAAGTLTVVLCESLPKTQKVSTASLTEVMSQADRIFVGDVSDAAELAAQFGSQGPTVVAHRALSLGGRGDRNDARKISAFLPRDNDEALATVLAAFDAIPHLWINDYQLQLIMRYAGEQVPDMVASSYHADHIRLIGEGISALDLGELCDSSSALSVADPAADSRAFSTAVDSGVATVVLASSPYPSVGKGYVGGLIADLSRPASVYVALNHALRLEALRFPSPDAWDGLARQLVRKPSGGRLDDDYEMASQGQ
jgi:hypothetical protein